MRLGKAPILLVPALLAATCAVAEAQAKAAPIARDPRTAVLDQIIPVDPRITTGTLANGLRYYIRANTMPQNRAELRLVVNAGSVLEDDDQQGLAHFVEHMAFNGSKHFARNELVRFMESIGMRMGPSVNAFTGFDDTTYLLQVPTDKPEVMEKAFLILEDWAQNLSFDSLEIEKERGVIVEEWRLGRGANARIQDRQFPILMKGSRYADRLPIGKKDIIERFRYDRLKKFYADWYRPDLMAVVAVGDFDPAVIEGLIRQHFGAMLNPPTERPRPLYEVPDHPGTLYGIATDKEATMTTAVVYNKLPAEEQQTVGSYRRMILENLYLGLFNNRLADLSRQPDPPFLAASVAHGLFVRSKEAASLGVVVKDGGVDRGLRAAFTEAERVARFGFTATELDRQKRDMLREYEALYAERDKHDSSTLAAEYIRNFTTGESIPGIAYEYELQQRFLPAIALAEVNGLATAWSGDRSRVVLVSGPQKEGVTVPDEATLAAVMAGVAAGKIEPYVDTGANAALLDAPPKGGRIVSSTAKEACGITEWQLSNGVRVVLKPTTFKADEVVFQAFAFGGMSLASDQDFNAVRMASQLVQMSGLGRFDPTELRKVRAGKMADLAPVISETEQGLSGTASPKDLETLFQLIYLTVTQPRADANIFSILTSQLKAILANQAASPGYAFNRMLQATLTQDHPRARPLTPETVDQLNLEKSLAFYRDRFADAGSFTFFFVGSFDPAAIRPLVEQYLGALPSTGRHETWRNVGIAPPPGVVKRTVVKGIEPKSQAAIVFTGPFEYDPAHRVALRAVAMALQGKLRDALREDLGGTYSVNVSASPVKIPEPRYSVSVGFGCDPARTDELVAAVFREIDALRTDGPREKQMADLREQMLRDYETNIRQNGYLLAQIAYKYMYGEDVQGIFDLPDLYRKLTSATVQDAARRYLTPRNYVQVTLLPETR